MIDMKTQISGKNIFNEMKKIAKSYLTRHGGTAACVGVKGLGAYRGQRLESGKARHCYVGVSGEPGLTLLRNSLNHVAGAAEKIDRGQLVDENGPLETFARQAVVYRSSQGAAIQNKEPWESHNCAEAHLAVYLLLNGMDTTDVTIATFDRTGVKPPCDQCAQWVRQRFQVMTQAR